MAATNGETPPRSRSSARKTAAGFLRRMMSSDDVSKKANKIAPVLLARAKSMNSSPKETAGKVGDVSRSPHKTRRARASSSPRNSLSVDELLECPICLDRLRKPKMLPCQHTFCMACLENHILEPARGMDPGITLIRCPSCRLEVKLPREKGLSALPPNLYIESLLRVMKNNSSSTPAQPSAVTSPTRTPAGGQVRCAQCDTTCEPRRCDHCKQGLCGVCWPRHMAELNEQLDAFREQLEGAQQRLQHRREDFKSRVEHLQTRIRAAVELKVRSLRETEARLNTEAGRLLADHNVSASELQQRLLRQLEAAPLAREQFQLADDSSKVSLFLREHRSASELLTAVSQWGEARPTLDEEALHIDTVQQQQQQHHQQHHQQRPVSDVPDVAAAGMQDVRLMEHEAITPDALSLSYRSRALQVPRLRLGRGSVARPAGLGVAPWANCTELYVTASDGHVVSVFDKRNGRLLRQLSSSEPPSQMLCPTSVAFCGRRAEVYISDKWRHCVHVFSREGRYLRQLGGKGRGEGQFVSPEGLACDSEEGVLYVCDTCNDRVQLVRLEDGVFVGQLGGAGATPSSPAHAQQHQHQHQQQQQQHAAVAEFNQPTDVALGGDRVVVCDHGNRRVKVYSRLTGHRVLEFGSLGSARGQFRSPECLAVDKLGFILVGDSGNGRVQVFRPGGQFVRAFGRYSWVSGVHVTPAFEIYVSDSKSHCVSIYN